MHFTSIQMCRPVVSRGADYSLTSYRPRLCFDSFAGHFLASYYGLALQNPKLFSNNLSVCGLSQVRKLSLKSQ
jgi:hypothetical protein